MANGFLPPEGVRVVHVTSSPAGPYCTEIPGALGVLGDLDYTDAELAVLEAYGVIRRVESRA